MDEKDGDETEQALHAKRGCVKVGGLTGCGAVVRDHGHSGTCDVSLVKLSIVSLNSCAERLCNLKHLPNYRLIRVLCVNVSLKPIKPRVWILRLAEPLDEIPAVLWKRAKLGIALDVMHPFVGSNLVPFVIRVKTLLV
jgi:hypothetical protein